MNPAAARSLSRAWYWAPRALGLLYAGFLGLFALDVFTETLGPAETAKALAMHFIPAAVMLLLVLIAWRHEVAGALLLTGAGIWYAVMARDHLAWILVVAVPLFALAGLFVLSGRARRPGAPSTGM